MSNQNLKVIRKILSLIFLLAMASMYARPNITIIMRNGGKNGYYSVLEHHSGCESSSLECYNPGHSPCRFQIMPCGFASYANIAIEYVENQVRMGRFVGVELLENVEIRWTSDESGESIDIVIELLD